MRVSLTLMLVGFLVGSNAWGEAKPLPRNVKEKVAKKACATGDYAKGIDILADLYVETKDPVYVYNQGRCYEENGQFGRAIERFREYLRKQPDLVADERGEVEKHIADCQDLMPKTTPLPPPTTPASPPVPDLVPAPPPASVPIPVRAATTSVPSAESGSALRAAGLITAGIGVAALGTAVVLNIKHESLVKEQSRPGNFSQSREDTVKAYQTWAWVGYGVGAAAVLAGGTMYILGRSSGHESGQVVTLLPVFETRGAGCLFQGAF